jgi:protein phosphatase 2C family protein 2/3
MKNSLPTMQPAKVGYKPFCQIMSYAANTHNGIARGYNEDRISIVLDLKKPSTAKNGSHQHKKASFFAVFDGHGGSNCAEYLRDNLHTFIAEQECFPINPEMAIKIGFKQAED